MFFNEDDTAVAGSEAETPAEDTTVEETPATEEATPAEGEATPESAE